MTDNSAKQRTDDACEKILIISGVGGHTESFSDWLRRTYGQAEVDRLFPPEEES